MKEHVVSVVCTIPGMAHKARNCARTECQRTGLCQARAGDSPASTGLLKPAGFIDMADRPADTSMQYIPPEKTSASMLPTDKQVRKDTPIGTGVLDYFPAALAEVARCSKVGNDQHNAGQPLHWARGKSQDHFDAMVRHGMERGTVDTDGIRHSAKVAWRALANLQQELEDAGEAPLSRGSK